MDSYKNKLNDYKISLKEDMVKQGEGSQAFINIFFDDSKSINDRVEAINNIGAFESDEDVNNALTLFKNTNENIVIRKSALKGLTSFACKNEAFVDDLIEILNNPNEQEYIQEAVFEILNNMTFSSPIIHAKKPSYLNALKGVIQTKKKSKEFLLAILNYLAIEKDDDTQHLLKKGLKNPKESLVSADVAIRLLSYDLHHDIKPFLRKLIDNSPNLRTKKEALRALSSDSKSKKLLVQILNDLDEHNSIRHIAALGLSSHSPEALIKSAKEILLSEKEDVQFQSAILNTINFISDSKNIGLDEEFQIRLNDFVKKSKSINLKKTYNRFYASKYKK